MSIRIDGTNTTANPGITGTDTDTGLQFGTDEVKIVTGGNDRVKVDSSGNVLIGTATSGEGTADNLTIADSGHCGITLRSGSSEVGTVFFSDGTSGDAQYKGYVQYDHSGDFLKWATAGTEKMRIHSGGEVTKSSQPAVACHDTTGWYIFNNGDIFIWNDPEYNVGNNYSTTNGRFTAPVEGYYLVTANLYFDTPSGNYSNAFYINKNGSQYAPSGAASPWQQHTFGSGTGDETNGFAYVIGLSEDDYIELKFGVQARVYRKHSHMTITLLH